MKMTGKESPHDLIMLYKTITAGYRKILRLFLKKQAAIL
jgi:hypothetical protein